MVSNSFGEMGGIIQSKLMGAFSAVAAGMSMLKGIQIAGQLEQNIIAFETLMGSAEKAKGMLEKLSDFAAKTPFRMAGIVQAARGLIMFGEEEDQVMDTLNVLGNAAAATSSDFGMLALIFNQVRGVGRLLTQDFRQLSTRGVISLQDIADHFGVVTEEAQKMLSTGKVSFEDLRAILKGLSSEGGRFENLMERQSTSLLGLWSTLQEEIEFLMRDIMQSIVPSLKAIQTAVIALTGSFRAMLDPGFIQILMMTAIAFGAIKVALWGVHTVWMLILANPLTIVLAAVAAAAAAVGAQMMKASKAMEEYYQIGEKARESGDKRRASMFKQMEELGDLTKKENLNNKEMKRASEIIDELTMYYGDLGVSIDKTTGKITGFSGAMKEMTKAMNAVAIVEVKAELEDLEGQFQQAKDDLPGGWTGFFNFNDEEVMEKMEKISAKAAAAKQRLKALQGEDGSSKDVLLGDEKDEEEEDDGKKKAEETSLDHAHKMAAIRIGLIKNEYDRERAGINEKYSLEISKAKGNSAEISNLNKQRQATLDAAETKMHRKSAANTAARVKREREQMEQLRGSMVESLKTPLERAGDELSKIMSLQLDPEWAFRALEGLSEKVKGMTATPMEFVMTGQVGFAEFGRQIQSALLKPEDPQKKVAANTKKSAELLENIETKMDNLQLQGYGP